MAATVAELFLSDAEPDQLGSRTRQRPERSPGPTKRQTRPPRPDQPRPNEPVERVSASEMLESLGVVIF